jgi:hypothetical protein
MVTFSGLILTNCIAKDLLLHLQNDIIITAHKLLPGEARMDEKVMIFGKSG